MEKDEDLNEILENGELTSYIPEEGKKSKIFLWIMLAVLFAVIAFFVLNNLFFKINLSTMFGAKPKATTNTQVVAPVAETPKGTLSGSVKLMSEKLGLMSKDWNSPDGPFYDANLKDFIYYDAGTFTSGNFKGYKRIAVLFQPIGMGGGNMIKIVATNDNITYILDGDPAEAAKYNQPTDYQNPFNGLDQTKVTKIAKLDSEQPDQIKINDQFTLYKGKIPIDSVSPVNDGGDWTYGIGEYKNYREVKVDFTDLKVFASSENPKSAYYDQLDAAGKEKADLIDQNTSGRSGLILVDSIGLPNYYYIGDKSGVLANIAQSDISASDKLYSKYSYAYPAACSGQSDTLIADNITDSDLEKIGGYKKTGIDFYRLKDLNSALLKIAYDEKTSFMYTGDYNQPYTVTTQTDIRPTYDAYASITPLIFFKDPLGRWEMFVEYQYLMPGGCGKPVIYLYPTKPTEVTVKFGKDMLLTRDIPAYDDGWRVLANPDGVLQDLQAGKTDCSKINENAKGLEYAKTACEKNRYPYIYWAGDVMDSIYPLANQGWSVSKDNLQSFLNEKLTFIGLNEKEKKDMMDYWVSEMLSKDAPYYRVSFFQNTTMDQFIPMNISPNPDSIGRVFLDWNPLSSKIDIQPQVLTKIMRNGFTAIEWGGIKK